MGDLSPESVADQGPTARPSRSKIVCLHGLGRTPADWDGVRPGLEAYGTVITPQLSRDPAVALEEVERAVPPNAIVVGHSMGGVLGLRLEQDTGISLAGLVLTNCFFPVARNGRGTLETLGDYGSHRLAYLRALRSAPAAPRAAPSRAGGFAALTSLVRLGTRKADFAAAARSVTAPVLVVHAKDDHYVPVDFAIAGAAQNSSWQLRLFDHGGHHVHIAEPEDWLGVVRPWLEARLIR